MDERPKVGTGLIVALFGGLLLVGSCEDDPSAPGAIPTEVGASLKALGPGIHPVFSAPGWSSVKRGTPIQTRMHLVGVELDGEIASYQGELRYNPKTVTIRDVEVPEGLMAVWNETEPGVIRFAGVAVEGLGEVPILEFEVESEGPIRGSDFQVTLEEVMAAEDFQELTDRVVEASAPVLTGERIVGG